MTAPAPTPLDLNAAAQAPTLLELQRAMRRGIVWGTDLDACAWIVAGGIDPSRRLDVYRNTVAGALTNALRLSYPAVHRLVGGECFDGAAARFIETYLPRCANLDDYGGELPEFLACFAPVAALDYLPDVARLEWLVSRALHAPDAEPLALAQVAALTVDEQARARFVPHPATALLRVDHPADSIWRAVLTQNDAALTAIDLASGPVWLLVHRSESGIDVSRLGEAAWRLTAGLFAGRALHAALGDAPCADAPSVLASHLAAGRFTGLEFGDAAME